MTKFALLCLVIFISQPLFAQQEDPKEIIARYSAAAQKGGDAVKGKLVFESEKANCTKCHNVITLNALNVPISVHKMQ